MCISIHALLAESDLFFGCDAAESRYFYPRSPCGERRCYSLRHSAQSGHFYPRSPCGERLHYDNYNLHCVEISIHALLAESDRPWVCLAGFACLFLSTLSLRRATRCTKEIGKHFVISIHALLAESDHAALQYQTRHGISIHALLAESD